MNRGGERAAPAARRETRSEPCRAGQPALGYRCFKIGAHRRRPQPYVPYGNRHRRAAGEVNAGPARIDGHMLPARTGRGADGLGVVVADDVWNF